MVKLSTRSQSRFTITPIGDCKRPGNTTGVLLRVRDLWSIRLELKWKTRHARLKRVEITSRSRSELKFAHAFATNPQARKINLIWGYTFVKASTRLLQRFSNILGRCKKHKIFVFVTQGSDPAQLWPKDPTPT